MVTNNIDYCNSLLYVISGHQLLRIQSIQNTAARLILQRDRWNTEQVLSELDLSIIEDYILILFLLSIGKYVKIR